MGGKGLLQIADIEVAGSAGVVYDVILVPQRLTELPQMPVEKVG